MSRVSEAITQLINEHLHENDLSLLSFCKENGLKQSSMHALMTGRVKNPSLDTLLELAGILNCSLEFLAGRSDTKDTFSPGFSCLNSDNPMDKAIYRQCFDAAEKAYKKYDIPLKPVIVLAIELYEYSMMTSEERGKKPAFNKEFAKYKSDFVKKCQEAKRK